MSKSGYIGQSVSVSCALRQVEQVSMLSVSKDEDSIYISAPSDNPILSTNIEQLQATVNVNVDDLTFLFTFNQLSCDLEGEYTIQINNETNAKATFELFIKSKYFFSKTKA